MSAGPAAISIPNGVAEEELRKLHIAMPDGVVQKRANPAAGEEEEEPAAGKSRRGGQRDIVNFACLMKYISLLVLVLQNTSQVLVMRYATTRNSGDNPPFLKTVAVFFNEVVKFSAALVLFFASTGDVRRSFSLLRHHFITNFLDTLKVGVPAFIYVIQNFLLYVAVENLDAGTYMVTYQLKILTTAMFTVLMLKRKLSIQQWVALLILIAGVAIVQISANQQKRSAAAAAAAAAADLLVANNLTTTTMAPTTTTTSTTDQLLLAATSITTDGNATNNGNGGQSPLLGFVTIIIACFLSGFAGIYFEKILKGSDVSVWLRNTQLAALSIPISLFVITVKDGQQVNAKGFMQGFDIVVWAVVLLQALGGLVVAVVIKYADNILKAFATSVSIVVATVASIFIFAIYPRLLFIGGATLVIAAVVLYGTFPYKKKRRAPKGGDGDDEELVKGGGGAGEELQVIVRKLSTAAEEEKEKKKAAQESANGTPPANSNGNGTLENDVEQKQRKQQQVTTAAAAGPPPPREEVPPRQEPPSTAAAVLKKQTAVVVDDDKQ